MLVIRVTWAQFAKSGGLLIISATCMSRKGSTLNDGAALKLLVSAFAASLACTRQKNDPSGRSLFGVQDVEPPAPPAPSATVALAVSVVNADEADTWNV